MYLQLNKGGDNKFGNYEYIQIIIIYKAHQKLI